MPLNQLRHDLATYAFPVFIFLIGKVQRYVYTLDLENNYLTVSIPHR